MSDWIQVDPERSKQPTLSKIRGVQINLLMSPYDVPKFVRGCRNPEKGTFVIEFRYLAEEPNWRSEVLDENITLRIGKSSNRLCGIEVNVERLQVDAVELRLGVPQIAANAIQKEASRLTRNAGTARLDRRANYEAARDAVLQAKDRLFAVR